MGSDCLSDPQKNSSICYTTGNSIIFHFLTLNSSVPSFLWETQDNGFLLVIDGVRKEKERLTAANLLRVIPGPFLPLPSLFPNLVPFGMVPRRMEERDKELE